MVLDGDGPATAYDTVGIAGTPVIQGIVDPAIPDGVAAPASPDDGDPVVPGADTLKYKENPVLPIPKAPMTSRASVPRVLGNSVPRKGYYWCLTNMFSSSKAQIRSRSVSVKLPRSPGGFSRSEGFARGAISVRLSNGVGESSSYATLKVPSMKLPSEVGPYIVLAST